MMYEYQVRTECERIDSINREIISEYENQTGISARSKEDLIEAFSIKDNVRAEVEQNLIKCMDMNKAEIRKKKAWKTVVFLGMPVSFVGGFVLAHKLLNK